MNIADENCSDRPIPSESAVREFESQLLAGWAASKWTESHVLLAVSGGADSVALLCATHRCKAKLGGPGALSVAHLDHGIRGAESIEDARWLVDFCKKLGLPLTIGKADVAKVANQLGDGWEAAARAARYEFLRQTAERIGARYVATAHTADDQVETVMQRIIRGTGMAGLAGIPASRKLSASVSLVRPMLRIRRSFVVRYLADLKQDFRHDSSNADSRFTRNRVRHELLPLLREKFSAEVDAAILRLAEQSRDYQHVIEIIADSIVERSVSIESCRDEHSCEGENVGHDSKLICKARRAIVHLERLSSLDRAVLCDVFRQIWRKANWPEQSMGYDQWRLLASMAREDVSPSTANLPGNIVARRGSDRLVCERLSLP